MIDYCVVVNYLLRDLVKLIVNVVAYMLQELWSLFSELNYILWSWATLWR